MNSYWSDKRVFVTGATGLVGSWLVKRLLESGASVTALVRDWDPQSELIRSGLVKRTTVVSGELEDYAALERAINSSEADSVFHLGAQAIVGVAHRNPLPTFESNIRGTYNLLQACLVHRDLVKRVVVASSDKAYGDSDVLPYTEDMPVAGRHPYDVSKSCTDLIAHCYHNTYGLPIGIARCGNIYGGGDLNWSRIVPGTIQSFLNGVAPIIRSDGTFTRDYIYIDDVVDSYLALAEALDGPQAQGKAFNFGPEKPRTVLEIVEAIACVMDVKIAPVIQNCAKAEIHDQYLDSSLARQVLGWEPRFTLEQGLRETVAWYRKYLS